MQHKEASRESKEDNTLLIRHARELHREVIALKLKLESCKYNERHFRDQLQSQIDTNRELRVKLAETDDYLRE